MTIGSISQPLTSEQLAQGVAPQADAQQTPQQAGDSTTISNTAQPDKSGFMDKMKNWIKQKMEDQNKPLTTSDKIQRFALSTVVGAGSGAFMIATGTAPVLSAIVGAAVGTVAMGGLGLFVGFLAGMIAEKGGKQGAMGKGSMIGAVTGGVLGAGIGGVSGYAQGHLLIALANACGGGPLGGAIAGGIFAGVSSLLSLIRRSEKEDNQQPPAGQTPPQPAPQPGAAPVQP